MILYTLKCTKSHEFEAWFKSAAAFDSLAAARQIACPVCGSKRVAKTIMAPRLGKARAGEEAAPPAAPPAKALAPDPKAAALRQQLRALRRQVEANCDYVGERFAEEARRIHYGESAPRGIYGEADETQARALAEEGVEVARIPWVPAEDA